MRLTGPDAAILFVTALGCAQPAPPPGGPEDRRAPELLALAPDSGATGVRPPRVVFRFDEVVSERPPGVASLEKLFLVSPMDGAPRVEWRRREITVRPRRDWKPSTTYTISLLPGLADLRGNVRRQGAVLVFSTGGPIPSTRLGGVIFDWNTGRAAARAMVEAIAEDSTVYVTIADSTGRFVLDHVPSGRYLIRGYVDANSNRALDPRELWDSVRVTLVDLVRAELAVFVHDSVGPRIATVTISDSVRLRVAFDKPVAVTQTIDSAMFELLAPDSSRVPIVRAIGARRDAAVRDSIRADSVRAAREAARDTASAAPPADTAGVVPLPPPAGAQRADTAIRMSRPLPETEALITLAAPLEPDTRYRLRAIDVRSLEGVSRTSDRVFLTPKPRARADTVAADTAGAPADTSAPPPIPPAAPPR